MIEKVKGCYGGDWGVHAVGLLHERDASTLKEGISHVQQHHARTLTCEISLLKGTREYSSLIVYNGVTFFIFKN